MIQYSRLVLCSYIFNSRCTRGLHNARLRYTYYRRIYTSKPALHHYKLNAKHIKVALYSDGLACYSYSYYSCFLRRLIIINLYIQRQTRTYRIVCNLTKTAVYELAIASQINDDKSIQACSVCPSSITSHDWYGDTNTSYYIGQHLFHL